MNLKKQFIYCFFSGSFAHAFIIGNGMGKTTDLTLTELTECPMFIRFNSVKLLHGCPICSWDHRTMQTKQPIEEKCNIFDAHLLPLKPVLNDSKLFHFRARISQHCPDHFNNQSTFLDYLQNRLLVFCDSSRGYKFIIYFDFESDADANPTTLNQSF